MWKKVVAPTALVSLIWALVSCGTSYILGQLDQSQTRLLNKNRNVIQAAGDMEENLWRLQATVLEAAEHLERGGSLRERYRTEAQSIERAFDQALARAEENASSTAERDLVRAIDRQFARYGAASRDQLAREHMSPDEAAQAVDAAMHLARTVVQPCEDLSELAQRLTNEAFQRRDRWRSRVDLGRVAFVIIGPALGILLGVAVARGLHHSISEISVTLRSASGDLEQEIGLVEVYPSPDMGGLPALQQQVHDVSVRIKQAVEQLQRARREAVRAERLAVVGELAAGVAHEVRNPLTSVKLLIQAIERNQSPDSTDRQRLQIVQQEIGRIETTIQELLDYARPPKLRRVRHDVRGTLRRALNLVGGRALQSRVAVDEQLGAEPMMVDADPEQLHQVFINLLLNAIEAMPSGGELHVTIDERAAPDKSLQVVIRDTGAGIPAQIMQRLFEPFVTSKERGIGLGLAISRQIMQEHGGRLTASNLPSGGAMLVAELPLADRETPTASPSGDSQTLEQASEMRREEAIEAASH
jgi:signal transduction histidine kinase